MGKTYRTYKGEDYDEKSRKKIKDKKFFGHSEDSWARLNGKNGKKRSYGHFYGLSANYPKHMVKRKKETTMDIDELYY